MSIPEYRHVPQNIQNFVRRYFRFEHLKPDLQARSAPFAHLAANILAQCEFKASTDVVADAFIDWAEIMVGLRFLRQAKDCVVSAYVPEA